MHVRATRHLAFCLGLVLVVCTALVTVRAQQKPTFRAGVELVAIDVNVVDPQARPVGDLRAGDFSVTVDGKPRTIASAQFLRYDMALGPAPRATAAGAAVTLTGRGPASPRNVLIVIDADSLEPGDGMIVRNAAKKFLARLAPDDRIGIVTIPRTGGGVKLERDREPAMKVLDNLATGNGRPRTLQLSINVGLAEAFQVERERGSGGSHESDTAQHIIARECHQATDEGCRQDVDMQLRHVALQGHLRGQQAIDALCGISEGLAEVPGPKTVLFISGGFPAPDLSPSAAYAQIGDALARGQVTLYTMFLEQPQFGQVKNVQSPSFNDDLMLEREGADTVTSIAGGTWIEANGSLDTHFDRVALELSGAYLLGLDVEPGDRDGRPHRVRVKVNRPNVQVRARSQYVIARKNAEAEPASRLAPGGDTEKNRARENVDPSLATLERTPADLLPVLARCSDYVVGYEDRVAAIAAVERVERRLSQPKGTRELPVWMVTEQRETRADYLLVRRPLTPGWDVVRDVFEVDGAQVHPQNGQLRQLFQADPPGIVGRAKGLNEASARHELDVVDRNTNVPTTAMMFLHPAYKDRFVFMKLREEVQSGVLVWRIGYEERSSPTLVQGDRGDLPLEGVLWIDPRQGRLISSVMRMDLGGVRAQITVTYAPIDASGAEWLPSEMTEFYTSSRFRFEVTSRYSNATRLDTVK